MSAKAIVGATLIDGSGKRPVADSVVVVKGDRIEAVGKQGEVKVPEGAEVIDGAGRWLLPGLIDLHVHLYSSGFVPVPTKGLGARLREPRRLEQPADGAPGGHHDAYAASPTGATSTSR